MFQAECNLPAFIASMLLCVDPDLQTGRLMSDTPAAATAKAIEADFGGRWGVWLSDTGRWWAARTGALTSDQLNAGCVPFIQASNPDELTERIRQQDSLSPADRDSAP
jgi:hypothetical protein